MTGFFKNVTGNVRRAALLALGLAAGVAGFAPAAQAAGDDGRYGDRYGKDYRHGDERRYDSVFRILPDGDAVADAVARIERVARQPADEYPQPSGAFPPIPGAGE